MAEKLTLASMCAGGVQERIDRALAKISDNILDLNTDAKKKRTLDIKIVLTPSEDDREDAVSYTHLDVYKRQVSEAAERYQVAGNYVAGANIAGFEKVVEAMLAQGVC